MILKLEWTEVMKSQTKTNTEPQQAMGIILNNISTTTEPLP